MHGWMQGIAEVRLAALEAWLADPNVVVDPAVGDAVAMIRAEFDSLTSGTTQAMFAQVFDHINLGEEVMSFVGIGMALAKVPTPYTVWFEIAFISVQGWNWLNERDDQIMSTGLAATLSEQLALELISDYSRLQNQEDLETMGMQARGSGSNSSPRR